MNNDGKKIGLAFSGGGYRAAAYHIGVLRTLNRLGILDKVDVISSVSGGSIVAAYYALHHTEGYEAFEASFVEKLQHSVVKKVYWTGITSILIVGLFFLVLPFFISVISNLLFLALLIVLFFWQYKVLPWNKFIERQYEKNFFGETKLKDLPEKPLVAINATDVETGTLFTFSRAKMSCYKYEYAKEPTKFHGDEFPISRAVMASSCVPHLFPPVKVDDRYQEGKILSNLLLVDGGLYDNQGAHKLTQTNSSYYTEYCIVSDAGNTYLSNAGSRNSLRLILKTIDIMMNRIRSMQSFLNMFTQLHPNSRFAYIALKWDKNDEVERFVNNVRNGNVYDEVISAHHITEQMVNDLKSADKDEREQAFSTMVDWVKYNIGWEELSQKTPSRAKLDIAQSVSTNLKALKPEQIDALIAHSEWLGEVQVRLYLPFLLNNRTKI